MKFLLVLALLVAAVSARRTFFGDQVLRISITNEHELKLIKSLEDRFTLDYWRESRSFEDTTDIRVQKQDLPAFKVALTRFKIHYEIFVEDVQQLISTERTLNSRESRDTSGFNYETYHTFDEIQQWISDIAAENPGVATASKVGTSYEGRDFNAITVGTSSTNPNFVLNCGIHAREWVTPATCLWSVMTLVNGYGSDSAITTLVDSVNFVFIPSSNPDGYAYTWSNDRMWRKTRKPNNVCVGTDPNRNWDAHWGEQGASGSPCSETYYGTAPFSEPCTLAQKNFVEALSPRMYVDVHAYSQYWMFPYGYTTGLSSNHLEMSAIASDSVNAIKAKHGMTYISGTIANVIYVASGSTADYFFDNGVPCAFATELRDTGRYGFVLPERLILPTAEESFEAFKVMAQALIDGKCHRTY